jgi:hypothetical protein
MPEKCDAIERCSLKQVSAVHASLVPYRLGLRNGQQELSRHFPPETFDFSNSFSVFEHLIMPW